MNIVCENGFFTITLPKTEFGIKRGNKTYELSNYDRRRSNLWKQ